MKIDGKAYKKKCTTEMVGRLTFVAESEVDAVQLAALFRQWVDNTGKARELREEALQEYCKAHNVTIKISGAT